MSGTVTDQIRVEDAARLPFYAGDIETIGESDTVGGTYHPLVHEKGREEEARHG